MSATVTPTDTFSDHYKWPTVWEGAFLPWYQDAKEQRPPDVRSGRAVAAMRDLVETLARQPSTFWLRGDAEHQLTQKFHISTSTARKLLRTAPGATMLPDGIWCAAAAAPVWHIVKRKVGAALRADALLTIGDIDAALDVEVDDTSIFSALASLCEDHAAVAIRNSPAEELYFCRARRGGQWADYGDLYRLRVGSAPKPAA